MSATPPRKTTAADRPPAVILGVQLPDVADPAFASSLTELERLAETLGLRVIGRVTQKRPSLASGTVVGRGKLRELAKFTGGPGVVPSYAAPRARAGAVDPEDDSADHDGLEDADDGELLESEGADEGQDAKAESDSPSELALSVLVDQDITPRQMRNLEKATGAEVLDRSMVILAIFQRHARTREAKMQVEIARLSYVAPRLREANAGGDRQRGGIGGKGAGEAALELRRREMRDRIAELKRALVIVRREADTRRSRRTGASTHTVALVGYTNAGKSRLMHALTGDEMYVADQLFATLDTTVRVLVPETRPRILVSDTVGFIKKLPHDLVASFRSTLQEAKDASLHLHVVDASDPAFRDQYRVTCEVLADIGAGERPRLLILNKADLLDDGVRQQLGQEFPDAIVMSAKSSEDVATLHGRITAFFEAAMDEETFLIPYDQQAKVALLHAHCRVLEERYEEDGAHIRVRAPSSVLGTLRMEIKPEVPSDEIGAAAESGDSPDGPRVAP